MSDHDFSTAAAYRFVVLIGIVSLFSDMTYQGAHSNAGPYLASLGATGTIVGLVAGGGELLNYLLRLFSGRWADQVRHYWLIAFLGYFVNLLAVPLLAVTHHWHAAAVLYLLERAGKGLRTPVRDVMLSHAADRVGRGWAFGLHEALDQTGGVLGPLLVAALLFRGDSYRTSFAWLALPAAAALMVLLATQRVFPHPERFAVPSANAPGGALPRAFWLFCAAMGLLALGYADFALLAFHVSKAGFLPAAWIPAAYALAMAVQGAASLGAGHLFDRFGPRILAGGALIGAAVAPLVFYGGAGGFCAGAACWAVGLGTQSSVMKAYVAELVGPERRGSAYGILSSVYGLLWFAGSALLGALYDRSVQGLVILSVSASAAAVIFLLATLRTHRNV